MSARKPHIQGYNLVGLTLLAALAAIAQIGQTTPARAQSLMRYAPSDFDIQRGLIAAGVLSARVGEANYKELTEAIDLYTKVYGKVDVSTRDAAAATVETITGHYKALSSAFDLREYNDTNEGLKVMLPSALVAHRKDEGDELQSFYRSKTDNVLVYTYRFNLQHNPPIEMLQKIFYEATDANIHSFEQSAHGFKIRLDDTREITGNGAETAPTLRHQMKQAFAAGGRVTGHYISYLDTPLNTFVVPAYLKPLVSYWTPPRTLLDVDDDLARKDQISVWIAERKLDPQQAVELTAVVDGDPAARSPESIDKLLAQWMWRRSMSAMAFLTASQFEEDNRWTVVDINKCKAETNAVAGARTVRIVFATNRTGSGELDASKASPTSWFGSTAEEKNTLTLGCASVSVPDDEAASMLLATAQQSKADRGDGAVTAREFGIVRSKFLGSVNAEQSAYQLRLNDRERWLFNDEGRALIFIHGYNTSFEYALLRLAQIAAATRYKGRVYLYSWPSAESWSSYWSDMDSAERSELHLTGFLRAILSDPEMRKVDIVAHSMGSQMLLRSLNDLRDVFYARDKIRLGQIIFAAPDLSTDVFAEKIREISALSEGITVYGSAKDKALQMSRRMRGSTRRLGLISEGLVPQIPGMSFIDATSPSNICNVWGYTQMEHSYFGESPAMLKHISAVLSRSIGTQAAQLAQEADLVEQSDEGHWVLKADNPTCWWNYQ